MELGEKLKAARLEAGLSQKALCGDTVTRNMLSQIGSMIPNIFVAKNCQRRAVAVPNNHGAVDIWIKNMRL